MRLREIIGFSLALQACATPPKARYETPVPRIYFPSVTIDQATQAHAEAAREVPHPLPEDIRTEISAELRLALEEEDVSIDEKILAIDYLERLGDKAFSRAEKLQGREREVDLVRAFKLYELAKIHIDKLVEQYDEEIDDMRSLQYPPLEKLRRIQEYQTILWKIKIKLGQKFLALIAAFDQTLHQQ